MLINEYNYKMYIFHAEVVVLLPNKMHTNAADDKNKTNQTYSEWHFEILSTPDIHLLVVGADLPKIGSVNGK